MSETHQSASPEGESVASESAAATPTTREVVLESFGGFRGFIDAGVPAFAFVVANMIAGLNAAIWAGAIAGVAIFALRLLRKESVQQAFSGLIGLGICIFIARQTGEAKDFFLLGIVRSIVFGAVLIGSAAIRRPLVGYAWNFFSPMPNWRDNPRLVRTFGWLTAAWGASFLLKFALEGAFYLADSTTGLGAMRIVLGYPMTIGLVLLTYVVGSKATGGKPLTLSFRRKKAASTDV